MVNITFVFYEYIVYKFTHGHNKIIRSCANCTEFYPIDGKLHSWMFT